MTQMVKSLSAVQETQFQSLDWEDSLEKEMAIHFSILAWKIPWTVHGVARVRQDLATKPPPTLLTQLN